MKLIKIKIINYYKSLGNIFYYKKNKVICLLLVLLIFINMVLLYINVYLFINNPFLINEEDLSITLTLPQNTEIGVNKVCQFNPFLDLFQKFNPRYKYFPSYFTNNHISISVINDFNLPNNDYNVYKSSYITDVIFNEQVIRLQDYNNRYAKLFYDLYCIVTDFHNNNNSIITLTH